MDDRIGLISFNLFMTALLALAVAAAGVLVILATAGVFTPDQTFDGLFAELITRLETADTNQEIVNYAIGAALVLVGFVIGMVQVALFTGRERLMIIQDSPQGTVRIARDSIAELVERKMCEDRAVSSCHSSIDEKEGELDIECSARVQMGADMTKVTTEGQRRVKEAVESLLSVHVRGVAVKAKYVTNRKGRLITVE